MSQSSPKAPSNLQIIGFILILSFICATVLSILASALEKPQEEAKALDRSQQMMIAARVMHPNGYFQVEDKEGKYIPAKYEQGGQLVPSEEIIFPTENQVLEVYNLRFPAFLLNDKGELTTFQEAGIDENEYVTNYKKSGYYKLPLKLLYKILPNPESAGEKVQDKDPVGYVIPVNGYGLWDAIYGYIAIQPDGETVIGISWYDQKETPGLGAVITEADWQKQFHGKLIYQPSPDGSVNFKTSPIGITVVRGKVSEVIGDVPKAKNAVDGIAGATLTGNGVTNAYKSVLDAYRPFFVDLHQESEQDSSTASLPVKQGGPHVSR